MRHDHIKSFSVLDADVMSRLGVMDSWLGVRDLVLTCWQLRHWSARPNTLRFIQIAIYYSGHVGKYKSNFFMMLGRFVYKQNSKPMTQKVFFPRVTQPQHNKDKKDQKNAHKVQPHVDVSSAQSEKSAVTSHPTAS